MTKFAILITVLYLLTGCSKPIPVSSPSATIQATIPSSPIPTNTYIHKSPVPDQSPVAIDPTNTPKVLYTSSPTVTPPPDPADWQNWPVVPTMTNRSLDIYRTGLTLGNNPRAFSKMGDCEIDTDWFLTNFDKSQAYYNLGPYEEELREVIDYFQGSFSRDSLAAQDGGSAATLLNPMWANPDICNSGETPLDCEIRIHKPSFALIAVGTNDTVRKDRFDGNLRRVIERLIELGVVPILATKADNLEGDHSINLTIARLSLEYDLMVWNFWSAVQPLPDHGLSEDGAHLTWARNDFSNPDNLEKAWPIRNLTALQLFNRIRRTVSNISK